MIDAQRQYVERLESVVSLTVDMLRLQRIYFRAPRGTVEKKQALEAAIVSERLVAKAIADLKQPEMKL